MKATNSMRQQHPYAATRRRCGREICLACFVGFYVLVSAVVYTDFPRRESLPPLTDLEQEGLGVWRRYNCQTCHQLYGFGGFLGPDLTNRVVDTAEDGGLGTILSGGLGKMPALGLNQPEQAAVLEFLRAMNRTGRSQPRPLAADVRVDPEQNYRWLTQEWGKDNGNEMSPLLASGAAVWDRNRCALCHVPFATGPTLAPDLSRWAIDLSEDAVANILEHGRGRMPSFDMAPGDLENLRAYLQWIASRRPELVALNNRLLQRQDFSWSRLPWFEYR